MSREFLPTHWPTFRRLIIIATAMLLMAEFAVGDEFDAVINDPSRAFTRRTSSPGKLNYGKLTLDSQGKVVSMSYREGEVSKTAKVAMGTLDEKTKKWMPGAVIQGGIAAAIFTDKGKEMRVQITLANDNKTISQILVKNTDEKLVKADAEFDAILKQVGPQTNGAGGIAYTRLELDEKGDVIKKFPLSTGSVRQETKIAMGKYNPTEKKWEVGDDIPNGLYGDIFKDLGAKTVYVRMTFRDDRKGISQILVRQVGEKGGK